MSNMGDDVRKFMLAGVGAAVVLAEKSKEWVEDLSQKGGKAFDDAKPLFEELERKGDETLKQGKVLGEELLTNIKRALGDIKREAEQMDLTEIEESLNGLTDEAIEALKRKLDDLSAHRQAQADETDATDSEQADDTDA